MQLTSYHITRHLKHKQFHYLMELKEDIPLIYNHSYTQTLAFYITQATIEEEDELFSSPFFLIPRPKLLASY